MTSERLRWFSMWTTAALVALILLLTLVVSPAHGGTLSRLLPLTFPLFRDETGYDTCVGGMSCEDGHALAFIALSISLTVHMLAGRRGMRSLMDAAGVLMLLMAFAAGDELAQGWTGRDASIDDWLADVSGAVLGVVLGAQIARVLVRDGVVR